MGITKNKKRILLPIGIIALIFSFITILYYEDKVPVLTYHSFYKYEDELTKDSLMINNIDAFDRQMKFLYKNNYKTLTMDEFYEWKKGNHKIPRKAVLITFDDANYALKMYAFDIMKKYNFNGSVFYVESYSNDTKKNKGIYDYISYEEIDLLKKEYPNIKFYSHSYNMHDRVVNDMSEEEIKNDIKEFKKYDEGKYYAYPFGIHDKRIKKELENSGYRLAFKFGPDSKDYVKARKSDDNYEISRLAINSDMSYYKFVIRLLMPY